MFRSFSPYSSGEPRRGIRFSYLSPIVCSSLGDSVIYLFCYLYLFSLFLMPSINQQSLTIIYPRVGSKRPPLPIHSRIYCDGKQKAWITFLMVSVPWFQNPQCPGNNCLQKSWCFSVELRWIQWICPREMQRNLFCSGEACFYDPTVLYSSASITLKSIK